MLAGADPGCMPSITRRRAVATLAGCAALGAIGGVVAHVTRKDAPHLTVNDQTGIELDVAMLDVTRDGRRAFARKPDSTVSEG